MCLCNFLSGYRLLKADAQLCHAFRIIIHYGENRHLYIKSWCIMRDTTIDVT